MLLFWVGLLIFNCWLTAIASDKPVINPVTAGIFVSLCGISGSCRAFVHKSSWKKILSGLGLVFALMGFAIAIAFLFGR
jgi:hypothetical protein